MQVWLIVPPDVYDVRLVFAHRAFCASEIFLRAAAERVRFVLFGFACIPVRRRPTKLPITWITWSRRPRSFSSSLQYPGEIRHVPPQLFEITARPYYGSSGTDAKQLFGVSVGVWLPALRSLVGG